ncbi:MAG TPA: hypothetical protein VFT78_14320 [Hanamia sp.]|nr:hypothetical protein [Hanamia sp.]
MPFQRDSIKDFAIYFGNFLLRGVYDLARYFFYKKRKRLMFRSIRGELLFILFCIAMTFVSFKATLWVFIIPLFIYRLVAMMDKIASQDTLKQDYLQKRNHQRNYGWLLAGGGVVFEIARHYCTDQEMLLFKESKLL